MSKQRLVVLGILVVSACRPDVKIVGGDAYLLPRAEGVCAKIDNTQRCAQAQEAAFLNANPNVGIRRAADTLILPLDKGRATVVVDTASGWHAAYNVVGWVVNRYWLLHGQYVEGDFYVLIDWTGGSQYPLWGIPRPSLSGRLLFVTSRDLDANYNPNGIQVLRVTKESVLTEAQIALENWGADDPVWWGDTAVSFRRVRFCEDWADGLFCSKPGRMRWDGRSWVVEGGR